MFAIVASPVRPVLSRDSMAKSSSRFARGRWAGLRAACIGVLALGITGCAQSIPPLNFSVPNAGLSQKALDAELRSITVSMARPDEQTGPINWREAVGADPYAIGSGRELIDTWRDGLTEALDRTLIFRDGGSKTVNLTVKILQLNVPSVGFSWTTTAAARYEVVDRSNGDILYTEDITTSATVPVTHAFSGATRARESVNRSVQNNITRFLQAAETIDVNRPVFRGRSG